MKSYIDTKINTAGLNHLGDMNDHVVIYQDINYRSGNKTYVIYVRKDFNPARGPELVTSDNAYEFVCRPKSERRGWQQVVDLSKNLPLEEAIRVGRETAKKENIALYLGDWLEDVIDWHPEGWEPRRG